MNSYTEQFAFWLADVALLSTALLAVVWLAFALVKQPSKRLAIFRAALAGLVALAVLPLASDWRALHLFEPEPQPPVVSEAQVAPQIIPDLAPQPRLPATQPRVQFSPNEVAPKPEAVARWSPSWQDGLAIAFAGGSLLMLAWMALGAWQARRLLRKAQPASETLQAIFAEQLSSRNHPARLLLSAEIACPVALGAWRPTVLIPSSWTRSETPSKLRSVLAHEAAHLRHGDLRLLAGCRLISLLYWAQPLFWILKRRVRLDQETLADAAAAEATSRHDYAQQLVGWARQANKLRTPRLAGSVGLWEGPSQLRCRVAVLLDEKFTLLRECSAKWRWACLLLMLAGSLALSVVTFQPASMAADDGEANSAELQAKIDAAIAVITRPKLIEPVEEWGAAIQELVEIGPPAVPSLLKSLDVERDALPLSKLAFTLRAIGDPRAIPALIRTIPRTFRISTSDFGLRCEDEEIREFLQKHQIRPNHNDELVSYGRPYREVIASLQHLSGGVSFEERELIYVSPRGLSDQQEQQEWLFHQLASHWAEWWEANWENYVSDQHYAKVSLIYRTQDTPFTGNQAVFSGFPAGSTIKLSGTQRGITISAVQDSPDDCFYDLDTGREARWPPELPHWGEVDETSPEVLAWARKEGFDLLGVREEGPDGEPKYGVRMLDMQAWSITDEELESLRSHGKVPNPLSRVAHRLVPLKYNGTPANGAEKFYGNSYLFFTREGTMGTVQLHEPGGRSDPAVVAEVRYFVGEAKSSLPASSTRNSAVVRAGSNTPMQKMANGATVQLLAIGTHGEAVPTWWRADGTALEKPGFTTAPANNISPLPKRQLVFTVEGMSGDANIRWETVPDSNTSRAAALFPDDPNERVKYYSHVFDATKPFTLRVGVASGEWNTLVSGLSGAGRLFNKSYVFSDAMVDQQGKTLVIVSHNFEGDVHVVAVDKENKEHLGIRRGGTAAPPLNQTKWAFDDVLPADIQTCRLQARGYEWVEFSKLPPGSGAKQEDAPAARARLVPDGTLTLTFSEADQRANLGDAIEKAPIPGIRQRPFHFSEEGRTPNAINGSVVDQSDQPLLGVTVSLYRRGGGRLIEVAHVETAAHGTFAIPRVLSEEELSREPPEEDILDMSPKPYLLVARQPGRVTRVCEGTAAVIRAGLQTIITLEKSATLHGKVVDDAGQPVVAALVDVRRGFNVYPLAGLQSALTDAQGRYEITDALPFDLAEFEKNKQDLFYTLTTSNVGIGAPSQEQEKMAPPLLEVRKPGFADQKSACRQIPGTVDIRLERPALITGRVAFEDGAPGAGLVVRAITSQNSVDESAPTGYYWADVDTDPEGNYRIATLPAGKYDLFVSNNEWTTTDPAWVQQGVKIFAVERERSNQAPDLVLSSGGMIRLKLVDAETDKPIQFHPGDKALLQLQYDWLPLGLQYRGFYTDLPENGELMIRSVVGEVRFGVQVAGTPYEDSPDGPEWGNPSEEPEMISLNVEKGKTVAATYQLKNRVGEVYAEKRAALARRAIREGDFQKAVDIATEALERKHADRYTPGFLSLRSRANLELKNYEQVVSDCESLLNIPGFDTRAMMELARLLATCPDESVRDLNRAVELAEQLAKHPDVGKPYNLGNAEVAQLLAEVYTAAGEHEKAAEAMQSLIPPNPTQTSMLERSFVLLKQEKYSEAIAELNHALEIESSTGKDQIYFYRAQAHAGLGNFAEAAADYEDVLLNEPSERVKLTATNNLAYLLATTKDESLRDAPRAVQLAEAAVREIRGHSEYEAMIKDALDTLATAYTAAGEEEKTRQTLDELQKVRPTVKP